MRFLRARLEMLHGLIARRLALFTLGCATAQALLGMPPDPPSASRFGTSYEQTDDGPPPVQTALLEEPEPIPLRPRTLSIAIPAQEPTPRLWNNPRAVSPPEPAKLPQPNSPLSEALPIIGPDRVDELETPTAADESERQPPADGTDLQPVDQPPVLEATSDAEEMTDPKDNSVHARHHGPSAQAMSQLSQPPPPCTHFVPENYNAASGTTPRRVVRPTKTLDAAVFFPEVQRQPVIWTAAQLADATKPRARRLLEAFGLIERQVPHAASDDNTRSAPSQPEVGSLTSPRSSGSRSWHHQPASQAETTSIPRELRQPPAIIQQYFSKMRPLQPDSSGNESSHNETDQQFVRSKPQEPPFEGGADLSPPARAGADSLDNASGLPFNGTKGAISMKLSDKEEIPPARLQTNDPTPTLPTRPRPQRVFVNATVGSLSMSPTYSPTSPAPQQVLADESNSRFELVAHPPGQDHPPSSNPTPLGQSESLTKVTLPVYRPRPVITSVDAKPGVSVSAAIAQQEQGTVTIPSELPEDARQASPPNSANDHGDVPDVLRLEVQPLPASEMPPAIGSEFPAPEETSHGNRLATASARPKPQVVRVAPAVSLAISGDSVPTGAAPMPLPGENIHQRDTNPSHTNTLPLGQQSGSPMAQPAPVVWQSTDRPTGNPATVASDNGPAPTPAGGEGATRRPAVDPGDAKPTASSPERPSPNLAVLTDPGAPDAASTKAEPELQIPSGLTNGSSSKAGEQLADSVRSGAQTNASPVPPQSTPAPTSAEPPTKDSPTPAPTSTEGYHAGTLITHRLLELSPRQASHIRTSFEVEKAIAVDQEICDVVQFSGHELAIIGKQPGRTHVRVWFKQQQHSTNYLVTVRSPIPNGADDIQCDKLRRVIEEMFPGARVEIVQDGNRLIVNGTASSNDEALQIVSLVRRLRLMPVIDRVVVKK